MPAATPLATVIVPTSVRTDVEAGVVKTFTASPSPPVTSTEVGMANVPYGPPEATGAVSVSTGGSKSKVRLGVTGADGLPESSYAVTAIAPVRVPGVVRVTVMVAVPAVMQVPARQVFCWPSTDSSVLTTSASAAVATTVNWYPAVATSASSNKPNSAWVGETSESVGGFWSTFRV